MVSVFFTVREVLGIYLMEAFEDLLLYSYFFFFFSTCLSFVSLISILSDSPPVVDDCGLVPVSVFGSCAYSPLRPFFPVLM